MHRSASARRLTVLLGLGAGVALLFSIARADTPDWSALQAQTDLLPRVRLNSATLLAQGKREIVEMTELEPSVVKCNVLTNLWNPAKDRTHEISQFLLRAHLATSEDMAGWNESAHARGLQQAALTSNESCAALTEHLSDQAEDSDQTLISLKVSHENYLQGFAKTRDSVQALVIASAALSAVVDQCQIPQNTFAPFKAYAETSMKVAEDLHIATNLEIRTWYSEAKLDAVASAKTMTTQECQAATQRLVATGPIALGNYQLLTGP